MKKLFPFIAAALLPLFLRANDTTLLDVAQFQICSYKSSIGQCELDHPFGVLINCNTIGPARLSQNNEHVSYSDGQAEALYGFKLAPGAGATVNLGAGVTNIRWSQNPYFGTQHFPFVNAGISGYSDALKGWFWQAGINAQIQTNSIDHGLIGWYSRWSALLWGRYSCQPDLGLHFGFLAFTGINKTVAYPILGVDWTFCKKWQLNLVFPINLALFYNFNENWSCSLAGRPFSARHRSSANQPIPDAIVEYHNYGTELSLNYTSCRLLWAIYGGYSYGNTMKFENQTGDTVGYAHFGGAPYFGLNFMWDF